MNMCAQIVTCNLDLITDPILMVIKPWHGAYMIPVGNMPNEKALGVMKKNYAPANSGNSHNAKWRRRRGGAYCSPLNSKFKGGI